MREVAKRLTDRSRSPKDDLPTRRPCRNEMPEDAAGGADVLGALKGSLQPVQANHAIVLYDRNREHSDPAVAGSFGADLGVKDEPEFAPERVITHLLESGLRMLAIVRNRPVALDRVSGRQTKQIVHLLGPGKPVVVGNIAVPVGNGGIRSSAIQLGRTREYVAL